MSSSKILVLNPSPGALNKVLKKQNGLCEASGPFEFVLLVGDVLKVDDVPSKLVDVSTQTYFGEGVSLHAANAEGSEVAENLAFMGKLGVRTHPNGLRIAYVTGDLTDVSPARINDVFNGEAPVDILLSYQWPSVIASELKLTLFGSSKIDTVVKLVKPRYHFACGSENGRFHERAPIFWANELRVTRFISLGQYGTKERFHYAFSLDLDSSSDLQNVDTGAANPFSIAHKSPMEQTAKRPVEDSGNVEAKDVKRVKKPKTVNPNRCFFCLSNPDIETHMIISIGENSYVTVAKGPLTRPRRDLIGFSGHGIIIPVSHVPTLHSTMENGESPLLKEIEDYKTAVVKMFQKINSDFKVVFFEISREKSVHYHVQFVPILAKYLDSKFDKSLQRALQNSEKYPKNYKLVFETVDDGKLGKIRASGAEYMLISIWDSPESQTHHLSIIEESEDATVDLQFPRRVLANVLNDHKRVYWDKCKQTKEKETEECELFKEAFKEFDFTL